MASACGKSLAWRLRSRWMIELEISSVDMGTPTGDLDLSRALPVIPDMAPVLLQEFPWLKIKSDKPKGAPASGRTGKRAHRQVGAPASGQRMGRPTVKGMSKQASTAENKSK